MERNNGLKEIDIKIRTFYYFVDIIKFEDFDLGNILIYEKPQENILVYETLYKTLVVTKPLCIRFNKIDALIRFYNGTRY